MTEDAPFTAPLTLDVHLPFSYWRERDLDHDGPALRPREGLAGAYARALMAEIASLGADVGESGLMVGGVFFSGGYLGLLDPEDFRDILRAIRRAFTVTACLRVEAVTSPGSVDMYATSAYLDEGVGALMLEVPTLSAREAAQLGLPNVLQALDKSIYVLASYGAGQIGLRIPADIPGRTPQTWAYLLGQVNHYRPVHVELVGGSRADESRTAFEGGLLSAGYRRVAGLDSRRAVFTRAADDPLFPRVTRGFEAARTYRTPQLGVGLCAETTIDGFWTKSTADMGVYLANAGDYRALIRQVREV